jgi:hypothetical protein
LDFTLLHLRVIAWISRHLRVVASAYRVISSFFKYVLTARTLWQAASHCVCFVRSSRNRFGVRRVVVPFSVGVRGLSLVISVRGCPWAHLSNLLRTCDCFPRVKRPGREAYHFRSLVPRLKVWSSTSSSPYALMVRTGRVLTVRFHLPCSDWTVECRRDFHVAVVPCSTLRHQTLAVHCSTLRHQTLAVPCSTLRHQTLAVHFSTLRHQTLAVKFRKYSVLSWRSSQGAGKDLTISSICGFGAECKGDNQVRVVTDSRTVTEPVHSDSKCNHFCVYRIPL